MRRVLLVLCIASSAAVVAAQTALPRYLGDPTRSSLGFAFVQAGAESRGSFTRFNTELRYEDKSLATSGLAVTVQIGSIDTKDKERDDALKGADLFDVARFPTATFVANSLARRSDGRLEAVGKLTLRGVTRDLRLPLSLQVAQENGKRVADLKGETTLKRLQFGIGQGDWKSTEWVGDDVKVSYAVRLLGAPAPTP
jgi:polyisoprenoid-binding protein YceI